jgi:formate/nitrite transporter
LTEHGLGYGVSRVAGGVVFSLGLMLVIVGGAELFTGNTLMVMAWASGKVSTGQVIRNWMIVYAGNFTGALATAVGIYLSQQWTFDAYQVGATAVTIAVAKVSYGFLPAFVLGVFGNALVCLAVWLCFSARPRTGGPTRGATRPADLGRIFPRQPAPGDTRQSGRRGGDGRSRLLVCLLTGEAGSSGRVDPATPHTRPCGGRPHDA